MNFYPNRGIFMLPTQKKNCSINCTFIILIFNTINKFFLFSSLKLSLFIYEKHDFSISLLCFLKEDIVFNFHGKSDNETTSWHLTGKVFFEWLLFAACFRNQKSIGKVGFDRNFNDFLDRL